MAGTVAQTGLRCWLVVEPDQGVRVPCNCWVVDEVAVQEPELPGQVGG